MPIDESVGRVKNPLAMVAVFAAISEVSMAFVITKLPDKLQEIFIWFVMGFPTVLVFVFFFILYRKPAVFFSPGDYKKEELYVSSIGLGKHDESIELRVKQMEETLITLQDFLEKASPGLLKADFGEVRKTIQRQQQLEANPLYAFITGRLQVEHALAQQLIASASNVNELLRLMENESIDRRKISRLSSVITSFPGTVVDFQSLKKLIDENGGGK